LVGQALKNTQEKGSIPFAVTKKKEIKRMYPNQYIQDDVFSDEFVILLDANKRKYELAKFKNLQHKRVLGVMVRRNGTGPQRYAFTGEPLAQDSTFDSSFLTIQKGTTLVHENIPLVEIEQATRENIGIGMPLNLTEIDIAKSYLTIATPVPLVAGEAICVRFVYTNQINER
jgi:hypothetical protein